MEVAAQACSVFLYLCVCYWWQLRRAVLAKTGIKFIIHKIQTEELLNLLMEAQLLPLILSCLEFRFWTAIQLCPGYQHKIKTSYSFLELSTLMHYIFEEACYKSHWMILQDSFPLEVTLSERRSDFQIFNYRDKFRILQPNESTDTHTDTHVQVHNIRDHFILTLSCIYKLVLTTLSDRKNPLSYENYQLEFCWFLLLI